MPPRFVSTILLSSILFLAVSADVNLDSSSQQQPPTAAADFYSSPPPPPPPPPTNFLATNNPNLDFSTPATTTTNTDTTTTFGINNNDLQSSSQQQVDAYDESRFAWPSSSATEGPLLLSSNECDKIQNGGGNPANGASGGQRRRRRRNEKRQSRNCPNPYIQTPNSPVNTVRIKESSDDDDSGGGQTQRAADGLLLQAKPKKDLSLCPNLERPFPVCARDDACFPMGDSWLISKGRPCK